MRMLKQMTTRLVRSGVGGLSRPRSSSNNRLKDDATDRFFLNCALGDHLPPPRSQHPRSNSPCTKQIYGHGDRTLNTTLTIQNYRGERKREREPTNIVEGRESTMIQKNLTEKISNTLEIHQKDIFLYVKKTNFLLIMAKNTRSTGLDLVNILVTIQNYSANRNINLFR